MNRIACGGLTAFLSDDRHREGPLSTPDARPGLIRRPGRRGKIGENPAYCRQIKLKI